MSGWTTPNQPNQPGPIVGWEAPSEPEGLGVRESFGAGWRVFRANLGTMMATAALPEIVRNLLILPTLLVTGRMFEQMWKLFTEIDFREYVDDQLGLQRRMQEAFQPPTDLALASTITSSLTITIGLIGLAIVTAATQTAVDGRRPSVGQAYRDVAAHAGALIVPAVIIGIGWALVSTPLTLSQGSIAIGAGTRSQQGLLAILGLVWFILGIAALVLAVRWSLAINAILAENLSLRRGLARSAELTSGIRVRIAVILLVLGLAFGFVVGFIALMAGVILAVATLSFNGGIVGYIAVTTIGGLIWLPLIAGVLSHIYRLRAGPIAAAGPVPDSLADVGSEDLPADPAPSA